MLRKIGLGLLALIAIALIATYTNFSSFRAEYVAELESGSQIAATRLGPIEYHIAGEGPTVLFLHGTPGGYDQGAEPDGNRVVSPSRPGYLRTPIDVGRTPLEQAHAYAALLDELGIERVYVMGASGGGPSSIAFASNYPDRTIALILLEAVARAMPDEPEEGPPGASSDFGMWAMLSLLSATQGPKGAVELLIPDPANQERILTDGNKLAAMQNLVWSIWPPSLRREGMQNDLAQFRQLGDLGIADITAPTLIVHGTADLSVPYSEGVYASEQIPNAVLHTIEGADHMMPFTHAEEMEAAINDFVASLPEST